MDSNSAESPKVDSITYYKKENLENLKDAEKGFRDRIIVVRADGEQVMHGRSGWIPVKKNDSNHSFSISHYVDDDEKHEAFEFRSSDETRIVFDVQDASDTDRAFTLRIQPEDGSYDDLIGSANDWFRFVWKQVSKNCA